MARKFTPISDTAVAFSGEFEEFNDPDTSADDIGSGPELGGAHDEVSTYDDLDDDQTINLTGQSETAMVADASAPGTAVNPAGSGSGGQQVSSVQPDPAATDAIATVAHPGTFGAVLSSIFHSPHAALANKSTATLVQTSQTGLSLHANLILFFIVGSFIGVMLVSSFES
jgi:hypothetical protein